MYNAVACGGQHGGGDKYIVYNRTDSQVDLQAGHFAKAKARIFQDHEKVQRAEPCERTPATQE